MKIWIKKNTDVVKSCELDKKKGRFFSRFFCRTGQVKCAVHRAS